MRRRRSPSRRLKFRRLADLALAAAILALGLVFIARMEQVSTRTPSGRLTVNDGDTLTIGSTRIRLKGVDAPEYHQSCSRNGGTYACGREARAVLAKLLEPADRSCGGWEVDRYGRLLATCQAGGRNVNAELVRQGWAMSYGDYRAEERDARSAKRGLWQGEFVPPRDWRQAQSDQPEEEHDFVGSIFGWLRQLFWQSSAS